MQTNQNWRDVIHQYLLACSEDGHDRQLETQKSRQHRFILDFGTTGLKERDTKRMDFLLRSQSQPASPENYRVIEERDGIVIAEVDAMEYGEPRMLTRFRVRQDEGVWHFDDMFWKCYCDAGRCFLCKGTGTCLACKGTGVTTRREIWGLLTIKRQCPICIGHSACKHCNGTGLCDRCRNSDMSGWESITQEFHSSGVQPRPES